MRRLAVLLLVVALVAVWGACAVHGDRLFAEAPAAASVHGAGCNVAFTLLGLMATLPLLSLTGRLWSPAGPQRPPGLAALLFQPPE
ncbi:MAG TPA: hypothetical protein DCQ64_33870 [Candidatus Rokubacteria bacterium]|nr:MAG: hypothetical protein A2X53_06780 [Candidatus Rokubacteria bacterium GWA2_70_23]HAM60130.1 hypothetical protein [Candidatus Rokubacteria bacterium]